MYLAGKDTDTTEEKLYVLICQRNYGLKKDVRESEVLLGYRLCGFPLTKPKYRWIHRPIKDWFCLTRVVHDSKNLCAVHSWEILAIEDLLLLKIGVKDLCTLILSYLTW